MQQTIQRRGRAAIVVVAALLLGTLSAVSTPAAPASADTWAEVQPILSRNNGEFASPPVATPSQAFADGPLLGNGDMTATLSGNADAQTVWISKNDFWSDHTYSGGGCCLSDTSPMVVGGVKVNIPGLSTASYSNEQQIGSGTVVSTFTTGTTTVTMSTWVSATQNVLVATLNSSSGADLPVSVDTFAQLAASGSATNSTESAGVDDDMMWATRSTNATDARWISRAALASRVLGAEYTTGSNDTSTSTASFSLAAGTPVTIVTALAGGVNAAATPTLASAEGTASGLSSGAVSTLRTAHVNWWKDYWSKSYIDLGGGEVEKYWYGSQYGLAASNRTGKTAPGLWAWNTTDAMYWYGDMHLNYNAESPYEGVHSSNRSELSDAYRDAILAYVPEGESLATAAGYDGVYFKVGISPFGYTTDDHFYNQKVDAVWAAYDFIQQYQYTLDTDYLRDVSYPFLLQVAAFWEQNLVCDGGTGATCVGGRFTIENSSPFENYPYDFNSTPDLALVKYLFRGMLQASTDLGVDASRRPLWQAFIDRMSDYPTGSSNGKTVWKIAEDDPGLGSIWNLAPLTTGDVGLGSSPTELQIAKDTVTEQDTWNQNNSFQNVFPAAVRAGLMETYSRMQDYLSTRLRNNLTVYQTGGGIETFGATEAVNDMLMQSQDDVVRLFPVWPTNRDARFTDLRAKNAFLVDGVFADGRVQSAQITSEKGKTLVVANPWASAPIVTDITAHSDVSYTTSGSTISFATTAGHTYTLDNPSGPGYTNLAPGATVSASSTDTGSGYAASKVNDGSVSVGFDGWSNNPGAAMPQWVQLDWGSNHSFNRVDLYTTDGYELGAYRIQYWDGTSWVDVVPAVTGNTSNHRTHTFSEVTASKIRVLATQGSTAQSSIARVNELQVYDIPPRDLAESARATASSTDSPYYNAAKINDGVASTGFDGWANPPGAAMPQWVELDWDLDQTFNRVELYTTTGYELSDYVVQYWNGSSWVNLFTSVTGNTSDHRVHSFPDVTASKIRVYATNGSAAQPAVARVNELEAYRD